MHLVDVRVRAIEPSALLFCHGFTNLLQSLLHLCSCRARTLRSGAGSVPVTWRRLQNTYTSSLQVTPNSGGEAVDVLRVELLSRKPCRNKARGIQQLLCSWDIPLLGCGSGTAWPGSSFGTKGQEIPVAGELDRANSVPWRPPACRAV